MILVNEENLKNTTSLKINDENKFKFQNLKILMIILQNIMILFIHMKLTVYQ